MKQLKKQSIGFNTVSSVDGVISARGVKSKPKNLKIFGYTHEVGEGEKSPDNPYELVPLDSGAMSVDGVDYEHSIIISNNTKIIRVPVPIALNSVEGVSDYIFKDSDGVWKLKQMCEKYAFTGDENFSLFGSTYRVFYIADVFTCYKRTNQKICTSNCYNGIENKKAASNLATSLNFSICFRNLESYYNTLYIRDDRFSTAEDFKNFLAEQYANGTPVTVIYQLETPEIHTLSDYAQDLLNSFELKNNNKIWVEGNPDIKISGYIQK